MVTEETRLNLHYARIGDLSGKLHVTCEGIFCHIGCDPDPFPEADKLDARESIKRVFKENS